MVFAAASIIKWQGIKGTFIRLGQIAGATVIGLGMGAFILIPAYLALQLTNSVDNQFPQMISFYEPWLKMISNVIGYHEPTAKEGLPNFYCGNVCSNSAWSIFNKQENKNKRKNYNSFISFIYNCKL